MSDDPSPFSAVPTASNEIEVDVSDVRSLVRNSEIALLRSEEDAVALQLAYLVDMLGVAVVELRLSRVQDTIFARGDGGTAVAVEDDEDDEDDDDGDIEDDDDDDEEAT